MTPTSQTTTKATEATTVNDKGETTLTYLNLLTIYY